MKRFAWNSLVLLSLLLFIATAALWARAQWACDYPVLNTPRLCLFFHTQRQTIRMGYAIWRPMQNEPLFNWSVEEPIPNLTEWESQSVMDVFMLDSGPNSQGGYYGLTVRYWILLAATGICPAVWLLARRRSRHRLMAGHCRRCGYDLRATPDRCPECGAMKETA